MEKVKQSRVILHSDLNNFFASVETMLHPEFKGKALAVCGDPEKRHGIVLAKSEAAKKCGIKTGMTIREASERCKDLIVTVPHHEEYVKVSEKVRRIYERYTDKVEPFGIDEAWLDVTSRRSSRSGKEIADELRAVIAKEIGITASVGVSFNKVFAKLGSDYKKPDATTVITEENFRDTVWKLPVSDLLYVGRHTAEKLTEYNIRTIGDLAAVDPDFLQRKFGKAGTVLYAYANGLDEEPVLGFEEEENTKSVGNSMTAYRDVVSVEDAKIPLFDLADSVAMRLAEAGLGKASTVQLFVRDSLLRSSTRQCKIPPSDLADVFARTALSLLAENYDFSVPIRSLGISVRDFSDGSGQTSLFDTPEKDEKKQKLQQTIYSLRDRFGEHAIERAVSYEDPKLTRDPEKHGNTEKK